MLIQSKSYLTQIKFVINDEKYFAKEKQQSHPFLFYT